jgi:hypothetical protein
MNTHPNFDPAKFFYTISRAQGRWGVEIVVVSLESKQTKIFHEVRFDMSEASLTRIRSHMDSLTDDQMDDFFSKGKRDKKKKGKE